MAKKIKITIDGVDISVDKEQFMDFESIELLIAADDGDAAAQLKFIKRIIGDDQWEQLKTNYRAKHGNLNAIDYMQYLGEDMSELAKKVRAVKN